MSFPTHTLPELRANEELHRWRTVPRDLVGKVVDSLEELKALFPENEEYDSVVESENSIKLDSPKVFVAGKMRRLLDAGFATYSRSKKGMPSNYIDSKDNVAYKCGSCERIIIGGPKIIPTNYPEHGPGREEVNYNCRATDCRASLETHNFGIRC